MSVDQLDNIDFTVIETCGSSFYHRHLSNIDCLKARTACLVCFISTVNGRSKKEEKKAIKTALVAGT